MDAALVSRIVSLIPERVARAQTGAAFGPGTTSSRHPERFSHLVQFLSWLSPLASITKEDQRILGLLHANGRPVHANEMEDEEGADLEDGGADALEYSESETALGGVRAEPLLAEEASAEHALLQEEAPVLKQALLPEEALA
jgi:hypothetical protein